MQALKLYLKEKISSFPKNNIMRLIISAILFSLISQASLAQINHEEENTANSKLMGIHYLKLKEGVDSSEFEQFVENEFLPSVKNSIPGFYIRIFRGERNVSPGEYIMIHDIQSKGIRDIYYPTKGVPSDLTKKFITLCGTKCEKAWETFHKMVDTISWADYEEISH